MMRRILKLIWSGSKRVSKPGRRVLGWLSRTDHPHRSQGRQVRNFRLLEHAIETGHSVTFSYLNRSQEESHRKIFPKKLLRRKEVIYCRTFNSGRKKYRAFGLDRIDDLGIDLRGNTGRRTSKKSGQIHEQGIAI
jgi:predicted DNA-binding transcriptional regulator YafY